MSQTLIGYRSMYKVSLFALLLLGSQAALAESGSLLIGYYEQWGVSSPNVHIRDLPLERFSHLIYESAELNDAGEVIASDPYADIHLMYPGDDMSRQPFAGSYNQLLKAKAEYPELKTLLTVGGWGRSSQFVKITRDNELLQHATKSIVDFINHYGFDGVDLYWHIPLEDPRKEQEIRPKTPEDIESFVLAIRREMNRQSELTQKKYFLTLTVDNVLLDYAPVIGRVAAELDFISLHTDYMYGSWDKVTHHISALYGPKTVFSVDGYIQLLKQSGVPTNKMVINVPPFGVGWQGIESNSSHGLYEKATSNSWGSWESDASNLLGLYGRAFLNRFLAMEGYEKHWDEQSKASYLYAPDRFEGHFISYESERAIREKLAYIETEKLAGIGVRQLHTDLNNESSLVRYIYSQLYPVHGFWLSVLDFYRLNRAYINTAIPVVLAACFIIGLMLLFKLKNKRAELFEVSRFRKLSQQLHSLEWPLMQLYQLAPLNKVKKQKLELDKLEDLNGTVAGLLKPVSHLLNETQLNKPDRPAEIQPVSVVEIRDQLQLMLSLHFSVEQSQVHIAMHDDATLYSDPIYLLQLIISIYGLLADTLGGVESIQIEGKSVNAGFYQMGIEGSHTKPNGYGFRSQDYWRLKDIYKVAYQVGIELQQIADGHTGFRFYLPVVQNAKPTALERWIYEQNQKLVEHKSAKQLSTENHLTYLNSLQDFGQSELPTADISKLIDHACHYFSVSLKQPLRFTIYQAGQLLFESGEEKEEGYKESFEYEAGEFRFVIQSEYPLEHDDTQYFAVLISQIQLVRRVLKELVKDQVLLSELYELANKKEQISYVKADHGYTSIYLSGQANSHCISMRLRAIKQYFDDDALLQIHRSYLVNPKKVIRVEQKNKYKFELISEDNTVLPVSRTHLAQLKNRYPHWF